MKEKKLIFQGIYDILRGRINKREFIPGTMLPSESQLCKTYSVSRASIRKALELLEKENLIYRQAGVGSFINEQNKSKNKPEQRLSIGITHGRNNIYTTSIYEGAREFCDSFNAQLVLISTEEFFKDRWKTLDGFIVLVGDNPFPYEKAGEIAAQGVPIALINRFSSIPEISYFTVDYENDSARAIKLLYQMGCQNIAMIGCASRHHYANDLRAAGYRVAVEQAGKKTKELDTSSDFSAVEAIRKFLRQEKPDSLFITLECMFEYTMMACLAENINPETDIKIFCFGEVDALFTTSGNIIYADMQTRHMSMEAAKHIIKRRLTPHLEPVAKKLYYSKFVINSKLI
ncbi:MAG: GntR family transcriptional regulator [Victivallales bacterium]|nr:GntR family transcriptional regulator [Victivallales bacterium]